MIYRKRSMIRNLEELNFSAGIYMTKKEKPDVYDPLAINPPIRKLEKKDPILKIENGKPIKIYDNRVFSKTLPVSAKDASKAAELPKFFFRLVIGGEKWATVCLVSNLKDAVKKSMEIEAAALRLGKKAPQMNIEYTADGENFKDVPRSIKEKAENLVKQDLIEKKRQTVFGQSVNTGSNVIHAEHLHLFYTNKAKLAG